MSKEGFKSFVKSNPSLATFVNNGKMTWQKFYEMYDLYGEKNSVWNDYIGITRTSFTETTSKINDIIKNVDIDSIKEHINTAQKALDFVQELTSKTPSVSKSIPTSRPLNKFFED